MKRIKKNIVVLYHKSCSSGDGFGAAWVAWKKFGKRASYIGVDHSDRVASAVTGKTLYLLDITFPMDEMRRLIKSAKYVVALDHHESTENETKTAHEYVYDLSRSGATIAWGYFFPKKKTPLFFRYLQDGDNWQYRLPLTKEFFASISTYEREFKVWSRLIREIEDKDGRKRHFKRGEAILSYENNLVERALESAYEVNLKGHRVYAVNSSTVPDYIGHRLARRSKAQFGIVWRRKKDIIAVSLRSYGRRDVGALAKSFGGGGHKHSSAFIIPKGKKFPWKEINKKN